MIENRWLTMSISSSNLDLLLLKPLPFLRSTSRNRNHNHRNALTLPRKNRSLLLIKARKGETTAAVVVEPPKLDRFQVLQGFPAPLGATPRDGGLNFAVYSANAVAATLCLITLSDLEQVTSSSSSSLLYRITEGLWDLLFLWFAE